MQPARIAIMLGSMRSNGNAAGLASWFLSVLRARALAAAPKETYEFVLIDQQTAPLPLGPVLDAIMPHSVTDPSQYTSPATRRWSEFVTSCTGFVIITPQYNGGYPGELKNSLDHLLNEWKDKPVMLATYGSRGGNLCRDQLKPILEKMLKMKLVSKDVGIALPREFVSGEKRVSKDAVLTEDETSDGRDTFLLTYKTAVEEAVDELFILCRPLEQAQ